LLGSPRDFLFIKSLLGEVWFHARNEAIHIENVRCKRVRFARASRGN
jgi:hypothetical protein